VARLPAARGQGGGSIGHRGSFGTSRHSGGSPLFPQRGGPESETQFSSFSGDGSAATRRIGYSQKIALSELITPRFDRRIVLRARPVDESGDPLKAIPRGWNPSALLWKGVTFSWFDARSGSWVEATDYESIAWDDASTLAVSPASLGGAAVRVEVEVVTPVFRNLVSPYFTREFGPVTPARSPGHIYRNDFGDLFPATPSIRRGMRYFLRVEPSPSGGIEFSTLTGDVHYTVGLPSSGFCRLYFLEPTTVEIDTGAAAAE